MKANVPPDREGLVVTVETQPNGMWIGKLWIDNELQRDLTKVERRPGCAIREVLNGLQGHWGAPSEKLIVTIEGW